MENKLSKEDLTNIIKIYKVFDDSEILMMIENPNLLTDDNLKLSLINMINIEENVLDKMKTYYDMYTFHTGGKGFNFLKKMIPKNLFKKKSKRKKSKRSRKKKKSKRRKSRNSMDSEKSSHKSKRNSNRSKNNESFNGLPNIIINNNNNNGSQNLEDKTIPQISIPLKFIISNDEIKDKKNDKKKGGTNIEINKSDGLDILKNSLKSGETEFNLTFDFNKNIDYKNQDFSKFMTTIKDFVKEKANDISNDKDVPQFKNELKQKINSINNLLPPFYSQDIVIP